VWMLAIALAAVAQTGQVEAIGLPEDASVSAAMRGVLQKSGSRLKGEDGTVLAELWLREGLPVQAAKETSGVIYDQIAESTLVGVIHFPGAFTDYRGQAIAAGFYTLRYALMPSDGNHLGAAPERDFLLLSPAGADADPKAPLKISEVMALSRQASGAKHPSPMSLVECSEGKPARLGKDDQERIVFSGALKLATGAELPFGLVVKGVAAQ
jgi:hypothetical protein